MTAAAPILALSYDLDVRNEGDGLAMLREMPDACAKLALFDPEYPTLDDLKYGNPGARQKARMELPQMAWEQIRAHGIEIERVLVPGGYAILFCDKKLLVSPPTPEPFAGLRKVDLICWDKQTFGMGARTRCVAEYLLIHQKGKAKANWLDRGMPDVWGEKITARRHAHQKPAGLLQSIIEAVTLPGDLVVNSCAGSFISLDVALAAGRHVLATDLEG